MTRQLVLSFVFLVCLGQVTGHTCAQGNLDQRISDLSKQISDGLIENQKRTIAVVEFGDLEGHVTNFGRFVAEELITRLHQTKKFTVIERQLLNKVVAEQKLSLSGMIDLASAQKLGRLLGVEAIASGTVTDLGKSLKVNARLISAGTGEIFATAAVEVYKDEGVCNLMGGCAAVPKDDELGARTKAKDHDANAIVTKDLGSLRIVLKSVLPIKLKDPKGRSVNGIRCSFEFTNRDIQRPLVVAANAEAGNDGWNSNSALGDVLRTTLVDERGTVWTQSRSALTGMGIVSVGWRDSQNIADPSEIVSLLQQLDETGVNVRSRPSFNYPRYSLVFGSTTPISGGQSVTVVMSFVQDAGETTAGPPPKLFQINSEIVVGVVTEGGKKSYSLHNVIFDRVSLSGGGS
jgi:TolB-like protein